MAITLNNLLTNPGQIYNGYYPKRPIWGVIATTNAVAPSSTNFFYYTFNKDSRFVPQSFDFGNGGSQSNNALGRLQGVTEISASSYYLAGNASAQLGTNTWSPSASWVGTPNVSQVGAQYNFDAFDTGTGMFFGSTFCTAPILSAGVVIGEPNWNQTFNLVAYDGKIAKIPLGSPSTMLTNNAVNSDVFYASSQMFAALGSPAGTLGAASLTTLAATSGNASARRNRGMICHNRRTGTLAYLEHTTTLANYRLHIIDLQNKIGQNTTNQEILNWINSAVAAGSSRYNFYDITLPSMSAAAASNQLQQAKIILCDDNTLWISVWDKANSSNGGSQRLYRCTNTSTYAPTLVVSNASTSAFGWDSGEQYGMRHMNSDDNSRVAVYTPYYYYLAGIQCHVMNTYTANASGSDLRYLAFTEASSTDGNMVVPVGGPDFMVCRSHANADGGQGMAMSNLSGSVLAGQSLSWTSVGSYLYPSISQSTSFGGVLPLKVLPTQEWKPASE